MPAMGKNAIYMMNEIIQKLDSINNYIPDAIPPLSMDRLKDLVSVSFPSREVFEKILVEQPLLQNVISSLVEFTKAMTIINAGIKENVIPDRCEAIIDFRLLPGQQVGPVIEGLKKLVETELGFPIKEKSTINEPSVSIEVFSASEGSYWNDWEKSEDLKTFHGIIDNVYKKKPFYILYPASADANFLRNNGFCPNTILFGPGSAGTAHAIDEYIEIKDFINSIKVFAIFAWKFLS
jgi:acetylornithine deacetylase/succinyl-diaminopimelate desuccinylase-like protein